MGSRDADVRPGDDGSRRRRRGVAEFRKGGGGGSGASRGDSPVVRDREAPGSNPGPPTKLLNSKSASNASSAASILVSSLPRRGRTGLGSSAPLHLIGRAPAYGSRVRRAAASMMPMTAPAAAPSSIVRPHGGGDGLVAAQMARMTVARTRTPVIAASIGDRRHSLVIATSSTSHATPRWRRHRLKYGRSAVDRVDSDVRMDCGSLSRRPIPRLRGRHDEASELVEAPAVPLNAWSRAARSTASPTDVLRSSYGRRAWISRPCQRACSFS